MFETDRALIQFQSVVQMMPAEPHDGLARAHLLVGTAADRLGDRATAVAAYDEEAWARLWEQSEELTGVTYAFPVTAGTA